jgi:CRISPR-associated protein Cst1
MSESAKLRWTGHALIDVGVAGVCALTKKKPPEEVTLDDLDRVSDFIASSYFSGRLDPYLSVVFTNNSGYCGPNKVDDPKGYAEVYRAHRVSPKDYLRPAVDSRCAFSGLPADVWVHRQHLPLFSAAEVMNFRPDGQTLVPIAASYLVALQFLPMASRRSEGRMLSVHSDDPTLTLWFAKHHLDRHRMLLELPLPTERAIVHPGYESELPMWDAAKKRYKYADAKGPRSLVISTLGEIAYKAAPSDSRPQTSALTAYLISNSGQGPSCEIFDVPGGVTSFVLKAAEATTAKAWEAVTKRFRPVKAQDEDEQSGAKVKKKASAKAPAPEGRPGWSKNPAFEALCSIYEPGFLDQQAAGRWLSRYVLGRMNDSKGSRRYEHTNARMWLLAELFLTEVMGMKAGRIETIKKFADKLADWIAAQNDKRLYRSLMMDRSSELRRVLRLIQQESAKAGTVLFGLDEYASVWLHEEGGDWLVRDLICIRVVEKLAQQKFFDQNPDAVVEELNKDDSNGEESEA